MSKIIFLIVMLVMTGISVAAIGEEPKDWGLPNDGWHLSLVIEEKEYLVGQPIGIKVVLQNIGQDAAKIPWGGGNVLYVIPADVTFSDGEKCPKTFWGERETFAPHGSNSLMKVAPQESDTITSITNLNRAYDMTLDGKYTIVVHRNLPSRADPNKWIDVVSNPVVITIKPTAADVSLRHPTPTTDTDHPSEQ